MIRILALICLVYTSFVSHAADKKVSLAAMEVPPFYGEDLPENGFIAAITREAFQRAGYQFEIQFMPWKRALGGAQNGLFDGVLGLYITEEREKTLLFTDTIYESHQVFIQKRTSQKKHEQNNELNNVLIAVQIGTHQAKAATELGFNIYPTNTNVDSLILLVKERVDLALMSFENFRYIQHSEEGISINWNGIEVVEPPFHGYGIYNAFSRKLPQSEEITQVFNKQLLAMKQDGTYEQILSRFGFSATPKFK